MQESTEYLYRNVSDKQRIRIFKRDDDTWDYDIIFKHNPEQNNFYNVMSTDESTALTRHEAKKHAEQFVGAITSIGYPKKLRRDW